jgi:prepilin-type N-terminal cleavage/methylation domain-containing protein
MLNQSRNRRSDDGFTLIELVIAVAILGIVLVALTGMVFQYMRNVGETTSRMNESSDQQFVSAYWQQDVSSLGLRAKPVSGNVPSAQSVWLGSSPNCAVSGTPVVSFSWRDFKGVSASDPTLAWTDAVLNTAAYYTTASGGQTSLYRKRCGDTNTDILLARYLTGDPTVTCADGAGAATSCDGSAPFPASVSIEITVRDLEAKVHDSTGYTTKLTAQRRQG